jgi:NADH-quinone oxidoreductase subunit N
MGFSFCYLIFGSTSFDALIKLNEVIFKSDFKIFASISFLFFSLAFLFKLGSVPFHSWICDIYEGSFISVTAFFAIVPKFILFGLLFRIFLLVTPDYSLLWGSLFFFGGFLSILVGSFGALYQRKVKRLLAYSAISNIGFILVSFTCNNSHSNISLVVYFFIYMFTSIAIFSLVMNTSLRWFLLKYLLN